MRKISVIGGAGNIGKMIIDKLIWMSICDSIVLCDVNEDTAKGTVIDIKQSAAVFGRDLNLIGTNDFSMIKDSNVVIVPAGVPRKPGMTRDDLLKVNSGIVKSIAKQIKTHASNAFVIVITNPLDIMVAAMYHYLGFDRKRVIGMAGVLDSARLTYQLGNLFNVSYDSIQPMVIGAHNDSMMPLLRYSTICGIPVTEYVKKCPNIDISEVVNKVQTGGAEIVGLLKTGSAYFAPANSAVLMADSILNNKNRVLSCSTLLNGEYGVKDLFVGTPVLLNKNGVDKVIELDLNAEEKGLFEKSVNSIKDVLKDFKFE
jgi:malate dehydrogenase